jgi:hypothetical protein
MTSVFPVPLPANSQIIGLADGAYFSDAYEMPMKKSCSPTATSTSTPKFLLGKRVRPTVRQ